MDFRASFCAFFSASASAVWPGEGFVQGEKNIGGKGRKGSFQVKQHPTGFIGSTDDITFWWWKLLVWPGCGVVYVTGGCK